MSGHSKWKNIMHKKAKGDAARAKIFTQIGREISVAVKEGGPDPSSNAKLRDLIAKAKSNNVPNDNVERMIKKAAGGEDKTNYEKLVYEGYGPCGVAVIVETLTDNKNRTASQVRHCFDKNNGNMGQTGCVSWMFTAKGVIVIDKAKGDQALDDALELGAEDFTEEDEAFVISTAPAEFSAVREGLEKAGYNIISAENEMVPSNYITVNGEEEMKLMRRMLEMLEDEDDVTNVYHNLENEDEVMGE